MSKATVTTNEEALYQKNYFNRLGELGDLTPETFKAFAQFERSANSQMFRLLFHILLGLKFSQDHNTDRGALLYL